jgi:hypothetical protein
MLKQPNNPSMPKETDIISQAYHGAYEIRFSPGAHRYWVRKTGDEKWESISGVTTILNKVIPKNLVQWAADQAVASLTPHLGQELTQTMLEDARNAHRVTKEEAGGIGKAVHAWVERFCLGKGKPIPLPDDEKELNGVTGFLNWWNKTGAEIIESERFVYQPEKHYIGTMDAYVKIKDKFYVADWKTGKNFYADHLLQVAGYSSAFRMETGNQIDGIIVAKFNKEDGTFEEKIIENITPLEQAFDRALRFSRDLDDAVKLVK